MGIVPRVPRYPLSSRWRHGHAWCRSSVTVRTSFTGQRRAPPPTRRLARRRMGRL